MTVGVAGSLLLAEGSHHTGEKLVTLLVDGLGGLVGMRTPSRRAARSRPCLGDRPSRDLALNTTWCDVLLSLPMVRSLRSENWSSFATRYARLIETQTVLGFSVGIVRVSCEKTP